MMHHHPQNSREWRVHDLRVERQGHVCRVRCCVDGEAVWFESTDVDLTPRIEAFASAFLMAAMHQRARVIVETPVDPLWLEGQRRLFAQYREWWYPYSTFPIVAETRGGPGARPSPLTATCFTGGLDSFHTLLTYPRQIDALFFIQGYDIPLDDHVRMQAFATSLHAVGDALNKKVLVIRSNLRSHHQFAPIDWIQSHGAAIVAGAHLVSGMIGRLIIPASYHKRMNVPWGSHWKTDAFHARQDLAFEHFGETYYRFQKLQKVAHHPLFLRHARVCWVNQSPTGNCSQCEKCLRTMVYMELLGVRSRSDAFDRHQSLVDRLDALPPLTHPSMNRPWSMLLAKSGSPELRRAISRLMDRSFPGVPLDLPPFYQMPGIRLQSVWNRWRSS